MKLKALKSFGGKISMYAGEVRDIVDEFIVKDLLRAGYVEPDAQEAEIVEKPVEKPAKSVENPPEKPAKKSTKRKKK